MVLDTSALIAILLGEPEAEAMLRAVAEDEVRLVGAPTLVEAAAVMHARKGPGGEVSLDDPAVLNYGNCLTYGVAMAARERLLFKGEDFRATDVGEVEY